MHQIDSCCFCRCCLLDTAAHLLLLLLAHAIPHADVLQHLLFQAGPRLLLFVRAVLHANVSQHVPVPRLYMMGFNILAGSHFDEYLLDFTSFKAGPISDAEDVFAVPSECDDKRRQAQQQQTQSEGSREAGVLASVAVMPWAHITGKRLDMGLQSLPGPLWSATHACKVFCSICME